MHQSTDKEASGFKDRERQRSNASHTRQSLGAVGRVASRVRSSSLSRLTKANSFLQRQKEEREADVNESPWGVGISAVAKVEQNLSHESRQSNEKDKPNISPRAELRSDMVELSSPLSADQHTPSQLLESTLQTAPREEEWPRKDRTSDRIGNEKIGGDRKTEKRTERVSSVLGAAGAARGLVKSVSRFGFRSNDRKANTQGALNDLNKARSAMPAPSNDLKEKDSPRQQEGKTTSDATEDTGRQRTVAKDDSSSAASPHPEALSDTRMRGFHLPGLGRGRAKQEDLEHKSKASEKLKMDVARSKNRTGVEKMVKSGIARSISLAPTGSPKTNHSGKESPKNGPDSGKSDNEKKNRNRKSFKDFEQKPRIGRASWFGFSGDSGDSQTRGTLAQSRGKSKDRRQRNSAEHNPESELGSRMTGKASKDVAEVQDFAIDEYFDSEEDDMETGSAPRSMVDDDFITYQTGKGKKAQGSRSKSRMKSQT